VLFVKTWVFLLKFLVKKTSFKHSLKNPFHFKQVNFNKFIMIGWSFFIVDGGQWIV
jgi:hypothetical protein